MLAQLVTDQHLRPWELRRLTRRQIEDLYHHPRDQKTGAILFPRADQARKLPDSLESDLATLNLINAMMADKGGLPNYEEARRKVIEKWQRKAKTT